MAKKGEQSGDRKIDVKDAIRLALVLRGSEVDEEAIRETLGELSVKSLSEVAQAFGVAAATVRHTWRRDGMPGDARGKKWPLADILLWFLRRNKSNAEARGVDEFTKRKREADTKAAEADARIKELKADREFGEWIPLSAAVSVLRGTYNVARDCLMGIPQKFKPRFPAKFAEEWVTDLDREIRNGLIVLSELPPERFLEAIDDGQKTD